MNEEEKLRGLADAARREMNCPFPEEDDELEFWVRISRRSLNKWFKENPYEEEDD